MNFTLTILGSASALPFSDRNPSAQALSVHGRLFLLDCGEGTQQRIRQEHLSFVKIEAVFISHIHGDHCFGLFGLLSTMSLYHRVAPLHIFGPQNLGPIIKFYLSYFGQDLGYEIVFHPITAKSPVVIVGIPSEDHATLGNVRGGTVSEANGGVERSETVEGGSPGQSAMDPEKGGILVHRIDKDTSGLLLVAKNDEAQLRLAKQFFNHTTERRYQAIVWGDIKEDEGTIDKNITRDPNDRLRFRVTDDPDEGKHAVTHYRVLERFGFVTLVECKLETGRTHQIRVHMASIGHPLFNDERYGGAEIRKGTIYSKYRQFIANCFEICPRQALHAKTLGFAHPVSGKWLQFDSVIPEDMTALLAKWRKYAGNMPPEEEEL